MIPRILGVLKLDVNTFEEIEADESATSQAAIIVTAVAILSAIGSAVAASAGSAALESLGEQGVELPFAIPQVSPVGAFISTLIGAYISWIVWSYLTYFIGTTLFNGQATPGEMLRVVGFAQAPLLANILQIIPCLGAIIAFVAAIYSLVTGFIGIRQGLDLDNGKTAITVVLSWIAALVVNFLVGFLFSFIL